MSKYFGIIFWVGMALIVWVSGSCEKEGLSQQSGSRGREEKTLDASVDVQVDLKKIESDTLTDLPIVVKNDAEIRDSKVEIVPDLKNDTRTPDTKIDTEILGIGSACRNSESCSGGHCTDGVCCTVSKCVDTCIPSATSSCPVYSGWTCAPYGTCRAF